MWHGVSEPGRLVASALRSGSSTAIRHSSRRRSVGFTGGSLAGIEAPGLARLRIPGPYCRDDQKMLISGRMRDSSKVRKPSLGQ